MAIFVAFIVFACPSAPAQAQPKGPDQKPGGFPGRPPGGMPMAGPMAISVIDTHCHLAGKGPQGADFAGAVQTALAAMDQFGVRKALVMPPPQPPDFRMGYEADEFHAALKKHPARFAFLAGGGSLNAMIGQARGGMAVSPEWRARFEAKADELIKSGAAGFGEMTAMHLSHFSGHPYEEVAADHPLFLLLADLAAKHDVPIDLHVECVVKDIALPSKFASPPNPKTLRATLPALERLLSHNRRARIVWAHCGSDFTGHWTPQLSRALLAKHPNLFMSLRVNPPGLAVTSPFDGRELKPDWAALFKEFPDRFVIGSDVFYSPPSATGQQIKMPPQASLMPLKGLLAQLPADVARKIGWENAAKIYKLKD